MATAELTSSRLEELLGDDADALLNHKCETFAASDLHLPGPDFVDRVFVHTDRNPQVLRNLQWLFEHGRLAGTGYVSILPVDQGIEHSAGASFAPNPLYFDPENIVELAIEGGCNAVASTLGVLGAMSAQVRAPDPVHRQAQPQRVADVPEHVRPDHVLDASQRAWELGAAGVGATIYFGSRGVRPPDRRGRAGVRGGPPARHVHRAVVLPAQQRRSRRTASTTTCPPTSPARPTTSA